MKGPWNKELRRPGAKRLSAELTIFESGKVKMIPGEQMLREFAKEFPDKE